MTQRYNKNEIIIEKNKYRRKEEERKARTIKFHDLIQLNIVFQKFLQLYSTYLI